MSRSARSHRSDAPVAARLRRRAWLLGLLATGFYLGFIAWNLLRTPGAGS